jgi:hypothetical protein
MIGDDLPDDDHILRYVKATSIREDGTVDGSEFRLRPNRPDDTGVSVQWLEFYRDLPKDDQLPRVRSVSRLKLGKKARFAELNIGQVKRHVAEELEAMRIVHWPLDAEGEHTADPSHAEITGLPPGDSDHAALVGDMIAQCIKELHPAIAE